MGVVVEASPAVRKVLTVESPVVRPLIEAILRKSGYRMLWETPATFTGRLREADLVLTDDAGVALVGACKGLPVVLLVEGAEPGEGYPEDVQVLNKPFSPKSLAAALSRALGDGAAIPKLEKKAVGSGMRSWRGGRLFPRGIRERAK